MSELSKKARNRTRVQMVLTMLVIVSIIRQFFLGNYHNMFLGILTLILFMVPQFIDKKLGVTIPVGLETVILIFIFSAEILGEINAFCFSMTVGVLWEFFEFSMDWFFGLDMQKDWIVPAINSVKLNPTGANIPIHVDVQSVVINGETWNLGGYLDIGIVDTMKDLMVNFVGAVVFSVIGILYLKHRGKGKLAASLIPQVRDTDAEVSEK